MSESEAKHPVLVVEPQEYSLDIKKGLQIQQSFVPKLAEYDGYVQVYNEIIKSEISPELCEKAGRLRKDLVKVRTGIAAVHKTEKAFYFQAGKFVDAIKNKLTTPVEQMEEKLGELEKYYENIEKERIVKLDADRKEALLAFVEDVTGLDLGNMPDEVWEAFYGAKKQAYEQRIEAERKAEEERQEKERVERLNQDRKNTLIGLWNFIDESDQNKNFGELQEKQFLAIEKKALEAKVKYEDEQKAIRQENERLRLEKEKADKLAEIEAQKKAKRNEELKPFIAFIRDYNKTLDLPEDQYQKELKELGVALKQQQEHDAKVKADVEAMRKKAAEWERKEQERIDRENEAKKKDQELLAAPDKDKLLSWVSGLEIQSLSLTTDEAIAVSNEIEEKFESFKKWANNQIKTRL